MTRRRRSDIEFIDAALEHLDMLGTHLDRGGLDDALIRDAVSHRLEVAIDALGRVSPALLEQEAPDDWPKIVGMRNLLAHQYTDLDQQIPAEHHRPSARRAPPPGGPAPRVTPMSTICS